MRPRLRRVQVDLEVAVLEAIPLLAAVELEEDGSEAREEAEMMAMDRASQHWNPVPIQVSCTSETADTLSIFLLFRDYLPSSMDGFVAPLGTASDFRN